MAVIIEMEMPKGCGWCRFYEETEEHSYCVAKDGKNWWMITFAEERLLANNRPSWCPLKECK